MTVSASHSGYTRTCLGCPSITDRTFRNRTWVNSMATKFSATRPLMLLGKLSSSCLSSTAERENLQELSDSHASPDDLLKDRSKQKNK